MATGGIKGFFGALRDAFHVSNSLYSNGAASADFAALAGAGVGDAARTAAKIGAAGSNRAVNTIYEAVSNAGDNLFGSAVGKDAVLNELRNIGYDAGKVAKMSTDELINMQNNMASAIDKGATGGFEAFMNNQGIQLQASGKAAPNLFNNNAVPTLGDYAGAWLRGTMADGSINLNAASLRKGMAIGGGVFAGSVIAGAIGGPRTQPVGGIAGGVGTAVGANAIGKSIQGTGL